MDSRVELTCLLQDAADDPVKWFASDKVELGDIVTKVGGFETESSSHAVVAVPQRSRCIVLLGQSHGDILLPVHLRCWFWVLLAKSHTLRGRWEWVSSITFDMLVAGLQNTVATFANIGDPFCTNVI